MLFVSFQINASLRKSELIFSRKEAQNFLRDNFMQATRPIIGFKQIFGKNMASPDYIIPIERFDNSKYIEDRVAAAPPEAAGSLRTALSYLYLISGPVNLPRPRLKTSEPFLDPAEIVIARWLQTRTNGSQRKNFGAPALRAARCQRYRCEQCGHEDVRKLHLDHINGRKNSGGFACLCANCHMIKSRIYDWSGCEKASEIGHT
jgi:hypothetical protein